MATAKDDKLTCVLRTRVSQPTWERLEKLRSRSNVRTMAEFLRAIVKKEKIIWYHKNAEWDALALEFAQIRKELNAIGRNINQITKAFHQVDQPAKRMMQAMRSEREYHRVGQKVIELIEMMNQAMVKWSRK